MSLPFRSVRGHRGRVTVFKHLGSAYAEAELTALLAAGEEKVADLGAAEQLELGLPTDAASPLRTRTIVGSRLSIHIDAVTQSWTRLGFDDAITDQVFFCLVLARLVESKSKADRKFIDFAENLTRVWCG